MKLLADEGIDRSIVDSLPKLGFNVFYVIEDVRSLADDIILQIALTENRILITRDKDFGELVFRLHQAHAGVILVRLEGYTSIERGDIVSRLVDQYQDQLAGSFSVIQKAIITLSNPTKLYPPLVLV